MKPQPQAYGGSVSYSSTVECEEMNDFGVMGQDVSQIHIKNQTNTLRMYNYGVPNTHKVLLCLLNWNGRMYGHGRDLKTGTSVQVD